MLWILVIVVWLVLGYNMFKLHRRAKYEDQVRDYLETCQKRRINALYGRSIAEDEDGS